MKKIFCLSPLNRKLCAAVVLSAGCLYAAHAVHDLGAHSSQEKSTSYPNEDPEREQIAYFLSNVLAPFMGSVGVGFLMVGGLACRRKGEEENAPEVSKYRDPQKSNVILFPQYRR